MKARLFTASLLAIGAVSFSAIGASAASITPVVSCSDGTVTAGGVTATACKGPFDGNDTGSGDLLGALNGGLFANVVGDLEWSLFGKSDEGGSGFTADNGLTSGNWSVLEAIKGPFVISLKSSTSYSAYLFDGSTPVTSGTFETLGVSVNGRGKAQALSHASLFIAQINDDGEDSVDVPEPATALALGMFTVGSLGCLKKKKA